ncbi:MAG: EAL domain-containing protein [Gammaproteobacteria bacterium]|nr:EAL domain-containing protein [Gammaproteobacteria bacterium]
MSDTSNKPSLLPNALLVFAITLSYALTGILGLTLIATPSGYATPIWMPSGIALGTSMIWGLRSLPGVFLGSLLLNFYISIQYGTQPSLFMPLIIGIIIGTGAVLQTIVGRQMIQKWVGLNNTLQYPNDILLFAFLSGPLSCLINCTWSNTLLYLIHTLPADHFLLSWTTWWVGDSIGVLIFTPLLLILFAKPRALWRPRVFWILIPLCITFIGVIALYLKVSTPIISGQNWSVLVTGLLFCVLINIILFTIYGQKHIAEIHSESELHRLAHFDTLTALPNRISFFEHLSHAIENANHLKMKLAVCLIDLDNFKQINDYLGHSLGDEALKALSKLLTATAPEHYLARLGGDEFVVIFENISSLNELKPLLMSYLNIAENPIKIVQQEALITFSMGVVIYSMMGESAEDMIKNAEIAMYQAKNAGKNTYFLFDDELSKKVKRLYNLNIKMTQALKNNEFSLKYQLMFDSKTKRPSAIEALIRWHNPSLGQVSPAEFISIAEKNGLIHPISEWVLRQACQDYQAIITTVSADEFMLSVNLSVSLLQDEKFLTFAKNLFRETNINRHNLIFEITETELMQHPVSAALLMHEFKKSGIRFALDDFGIAYSSIRYLKNLPVSFIKIDRIFVEHITQNKDDVLIIKAIIELAHNLNIKIIAEGIEIEEQFQILKELKSDYIQGYYFAEPFSRQEIIDKLKAFY